jgi:hypothetical protein
VLEDNFTIGGFKEIGTGARDYGFGIIRIDEQYLKDKKIMESWSRHTLIRVKRPDRGKTAYGVLRVIPHTLTGEPTALPLICIEEDVIQIAQVLWRASAV